MNNYNEVPVEFCKNCFGLGIKEEDGMVFCKDCGGGSILTSPFKTWEELFYEEYGQPYLNLPNDTFKQII